ncbi:DNA-binding GntR family transcriptional regulator [Pantoea sp. PA1]|jgi:DNA-binding GntR family transcriptional regulator|uniref:NtaR n=3 Tax=Pantoea ananas TaxID=553 RepID=D4GJK2_PANAM|nr:MULTISPECIES: GntR family transcriptional regulator [Pantoea]ADD75812.1 NtaR [Pantoea ananatis LMG 20103]AER34045.1 nta operon transcriptional regulator NtaR [Pantoea ananatis PA13]AMB74608.1 GntR family transcriptional regulator [Pantoea ananatis]ASN16534.1 GntR family transcriptional regulator [Pantoea ananatis]AVG75723.1 GntR family transcriptional regulator [Pantoea ananatis]
MTTRLPRNKARPEALAERVYQTLKNDIFEFRLMPGDRFSESEIAERMAVSRTPVRQALFWLEREGYVDVWFRSGWQVKTFDFAYFEELYDLRTVLECEAVKRLCELPSAQCAARLRELYQFWCEAARLDDGKKVSQHDEAFHMTLVAAAGNSEIARIHAELTEKIRIIRRLDFTREDRIAATYREHAQILQAIFLQQTGKAQQMLSEHIAASKAEVRKITIHMLQQARLQPIE